MNSLILIEIGFILGMIFVLALAYLVKIWCRRHNVHFCFVCSTEISHSSCLLEPETTYAHLKVLYRRFAGMGTRSKYRRIKYWAYLPVYTYRWALHLQGKHDDHEPMFPEWMTREECRKITTASARRGIFY